MQSFAPPSFRAAYNLTTDSGLYCFTSRLNLPGVALLVPLVDILKSSAPIAFFKKSDCNASSDASLSINKNRLTAAPLNLNRCRCWYPRGSTYEASLKRSASLLRSKSKGYPDRALQTLVQVLSPDVAHQQARLYPQLTADAGGAQAWPMTTSSWCPGAGTRYTRCVYNNSHEYRQFKGTVIGRAS